MYGEPEPKAQSNFTAESDHEDEHGELAAVDDAHQIVGRAEANDVLPMAVERRGRMRDMPARRTFGLEERASRGVWRWVGRGSVDPAKRPATDRMKKKLETEAGRARYARRKWLSEAPNGWIKEVLGFRRFSFRGLAKVQAEWNLCAWP